MLGTDRFGDKSKDGFPGDSSIGVDVTVDHPLGNSDLELLKQMQAMNRSNEQDSRSVVSGYGTGTSLSDSRSHVSGENGALNHSGEDESQIDEDLLYTWGDLVQNWVNEYNRRPQYIHSLSRRGIPTHFRSIVWQLLTGADVGSVRELYSKYVITPAPYENRIRQCISRCHYAQHRIIKDDAIFSVLKAYSLHRKGITCRLENLVYIVQTLLSQMPEPETFSVLLRLMGAYKLSQLYNPSMTDLAVRVYQFEYLLRTICPDLYTHLSKVNLDVSAYASSWLLTFFAEHLTIELSNRIIDVFICEGIDVVLRLAVAALLICQRDLLQLDGEGVKRYFQFGMSQKLDQDHDLLIDTAFQLKVDSEKMKELEVDLTTPGKISPSDNEDEEMMEFRKLRTANALLRQRITRLEDDSSFLADELIAIEPSQSETQSLENGSKLKTELLHLRRCNSDIHRRLEEAYQTIKELTAKGSEDTAEKEVQVDDQPTIEHIHVLQEQVIEARAREANYSALTKELRIRARELDLANEKLKSAPDHECLTNLRDELTEIRQRESEANKLLSETRQKIKALNEDWEHFMSKQPQNSDGPVTSEEIHQQIMGALIREAEALAEMKEASQRVMELETQSHVLGNHLRRQDEEYKSLQEKIDSGPANEREVQCGLRETQHKRADVEARLKEEAVLSRLREAELLESIADLKRQLSEMESSYFEKWTQEELNKDGLHNDSFDDDGDDDDDDTETLDGIDSSYHSGEVTTEDDFESCTARAGPKSNQEAKKRSYEALSNLMLMGGQHIDTGS